MKRLAVTAVAIAAVLGAGLLVSSSAAPEEAPDNGIQRWEYKFVPLVELYKVFTENRDDEDDPYDDTEAWKTFSRTVESKYNQLGKDGWELVNIAQMYPYAVFKRPR